jgi:membrane fusion protein (multidrug efflux system)
MAVKDSNFMAKRMLVMLTLTILFVGGLGFVKFKQIQTAIAQGAAYQPPPEAVTTVVAAQAQWPSTLNAIGTMAAVRGVTVSADLAGIVDQILFDSGEAVREGQVLVILDTRQEQAQMAAAEAHRVLARLNFNRMQDLLDQRVVSKAEYDSASAESRQADAGVGEVRAAIERKTIRAPFSGILGIRRSTRVSTRGRSGRAATGARSRSRDSACAASVGDPLGEPSTSPATPSGAVRSTDA